MSFPSKDTLPGGQIGVAPKSEANQLVEVAFNPLAKDDGSQGQFARFPAATPKYAQHLGQREAEYKETMARMFIQMPKQERAKFVNSVPPETRELAKVLSGGVDGFGFMDFLLTNVTEPFQEKFQIVETLSDNFIVYLFGQKAPIFQYSGVLLNTYQDDQRVWLTRLYRDILRGTQLARRQKLVRLRYDSVIVSGILIAMQQVIEGEAADWVQFSFSLIPTQYVIFTPSLGKPTQLQQPFIPSKGYGLMSTGVPSSKQLRVSQVAKGKSRAVAATEKTEVSSARDEHIKRATPDQQTTKAAKQQEQNRELYRPPPQSSTLDEALRGGPQSR